MALLHVLVGALQDRLLLQAGDGLLLVYTAQPGLSVGDAAAEVESSVGCLRFLLAAFPGEDESLGETVLERQRLGLVLMVVFVTVLASERKIR